MEVWVDEEEAEEEEAEQQDVVCEDDSRGATRCESSGGAPSHWRSTASMAAMTADTQQG